MKTKIFSLALSALLLAVAGGATAATTDTAALIRDLQQQLAALQQQLELLQKLQTTGTVETEPMRVVGVGFSETLSAGSRGAAVSRLQEFLKKYPNVYPEGRVTGYFGPLTEAAVKRFQAEYGIEAIGVVGPKTRAKLNELLLASAAPAPQPSTPAATTTPPAAATTTPATPTTTATTTPAVPPAPATTTAAVTPPSQYQLGLPLIKFFGWNRTSLKLQFTHDPGNYTRSYAIYLRSPGETADVRWGPYTTTAVGQTRTFSGGVTFAQLGGNVWEWTQTFDFGARPEGTYQVYATAVGDGGVESASSPGWVATLYPAVVFGNLLQGTPSRDVVNFVVNGFPLTLRLSNPYASLYYQYTLYDGDMVVWDRGYYKQSTTPQIEVVFNNANGYPFVSGKTYRVHVEAFDNDSGLDSQTKQKPTEFTFTYTPAS